MTKLTDRTLVVHLAQYAPEGLQHLLELRDKQRFAIEHAKRDLIESEIAILSELQISERFIPDKDEVKEIMKRVKHRAKQNGKMVRVN